MDRSSPTRGRRRRWVDSRPAASSAGSGTRSLGEPIIFTTASSVTTAATSASNTSAAHCIAQSIAEDGSGLAATATRNSASCCVDQLLGGVVMSVVVMPSAEGEHHQRLIVKSADAANARDLAVGVEAGNGRALRERPDPLDLLANSGVTEDTAPRDAVEREKTERRLSRQPVDRLRARGGGGLQDRIGVAFHDPCQAALRNLGDAADGAVLEIRLGDEAHLLTAAPAQTERMGERETRERGGVGTHVVGSLEAFEVDVERGTVVEGEPPGPAARGHQERRADPAPAVLDADAKRG